MESAVTDVAEETSNETILDVADEATESSDVSVVASLAGDEATEVVVDEGAYVTIDAVESDTVG